MLNEQTQQREDHRLTAELGVSDRAVSQTVACQKVFSGDSLVHGLFVLPGKGPLSSALFTLPSDHSWAENLKRNHLFVD